MRYKYQGVAKDGNGRVIQSATVSVYKAGGTTVASVYTAESGGSAVNFVTSDTSGYFYFWVDETDYLNTQRFKIVISKTSFMSKTYDNIDIFAVSAAVSDVVYGSSWNSVGTIAPSKNTVYDKIETSFLSHAYFPDYNEVDQGATGNGKSTKTYIDTIGTDAATLVFRHNSGSATTTYTFTTDETIPSNINIIVENGVNLDGAGTLTINGPVSFPDNQVFGSSITIAGTPLVSDVNPEWWYSGTGSASTAVQAAIDLGLKVKVRRLYTTSTGLTVATKGQIIEGVGRDKSGFVADAAIDILTIQANRYITIRDMIFDGNSAGTKGIKGEFPKGVVQDCEFREFITAGVDIGVSSFSWRITNNSFISNIAAGVTLSYGGSNNDTHILENIFQNNGTCGINITSGTPSYSDGIFISDNDFENNCTTGTALSPFAHVQIGGGTTNVFFDGNYMETDISQTGFENQLFVDVGAGSVNINITNTYMNPSAVQKLNHLIKLGASSRFITIDNCNLKNFNTSAIDNDLGSGGTLFLGSNITDAVDEENIINEAMFNVFLTPQLGRAIHGQLALLKNRVLVDGTASKYLITDGVPTDSTFIPVTANIRADTALTATTGDFLGVGWDAANSRTNYGYSDAAAASVFPQNTKISFLNAPGKANGVTNAGTGLQLMSVDAITDGALLANSYGGASQYVTIFVTGWLIKSLLDV